MKIDEPKTPFVRNHPELESDDGGDIPSFDLDGENPTPASPDAATFHATTQANTLANSTASSRPQTSGSPSAGSQSPGGRFTRSSSADRNSRRPSFSTSRSASSSRSASFSNPPDDLGRTEFREGGLGLIRNGDEVLEDEEILDEETVAKRAEFRKARGRHYSNEAEAMKRAQALMAAENDEDDDGDSDMQNGPTTTTNGIPPVPPLTNGSAR